MSESSNGTSHMVLGFAAGMVAGVAAGILMAPKSGQETRQLISEKAHNAIDKAEDTAKNTVEQVKDKATMVANKTKAAVREGQRAARES